MPRKLGTKRILYLKKLLNFQSKVREVFKRYHVSLPLAVVTTRTTTVRVGGLRRQQTHSSDTCRHVDQHTQHCLGTTAKHQERKRSWLPEPFQENSKGCSGHGVSTIQENSKGCSGHGVSTIQENSKGCSGHGVSTMGVFKGGASNSQAPSTCTSLAHAGNAQERRNNNKKNARTRSRSA